MLFHSRNSRLLRRALSQIYCCNKRSTTTAILLGNAKDQRKILLPRKIVSTPVRLRPSNADPWKEELTGRLTKYYNNQNKYGYGNPELFQIITNRNVNQAQIKEIKNSSFDIKREAIGASSDQLEFLKRSDEWMGMPGYNTMLCAFKCKPLPTCEQIGQDPVNWIDVENEKDPFDQSQLEALSAALNPKRPIVAIHGPPGTGKTRLIVRYLEELRKQGRRSIVLSPSMAALYNLIGNYQERTSDLDFLILRYYNEELAKKIIRDPNTRLTIKERSMQKMSMDVQGQKTQKYYGMTKYLQHEMEKAEKGGENTELLEEMAEVRQQGIEESHELKVLDMKRHIEENGQIVFTTSSRSTINMLKRSEITFDVLIVEEATGINEFETWWMGLPLAPTLRQFGNQHENAQPLSSPEARELGFQKSLLERLDDEFGPEMNFHLQHQYRSAPAIQEWPNSVFYGKRAAVASELVKNIKLDDLLVPDAKMVTDPLVLVDLSQIEGEWDEHMFKPHQGGRSFYNWGEALLVVEHMRQLFKNLKHSGASYITYFAQLQAQYIQIREIFECFFPSQLENLQMVRFGKSNEFQGQSVEVVLRSYVTTPRDIFKDLYHLRHLAFEMTRARRQFMLLANSEWLEEGSAESRQLLETFRNHGRIIGPNDLLQMNREKFYQMQRKLKNRYNKRRRLEQTTRN